MGQEKDQWGARKAEDSEDYRCNRGDKSGNLNIIAVKFHGVQTKVPRVKRFSQVLSR
jgi:hypothetical protein